MRQILLAMGLALAVAQAHPDPADAAARETWIPEGVLPYYQPAVRRDLSPTVRVHPDYDTLLSSTRQADIIAARDRMEADPGLVSPVTFMVLAIRLYDVGLRDDAVFWFYVSKYRGVTLRDVAEWRTGPFGDGWVDAMGALITLAGPYFNGYAFCDIANQGRINRRAVDWVETHPYQGFSSPALKDRLKPGDLDENLKASITGLREAVAKETAQLQDPETLEWPRDGRKESHADARFCWK